MDLVASQGPDRRPEVGIFKGSMLRIELKYSRAGG
jgi:hypothetical protein